MANAIRHAKHSNRTSPSAHIWISNDARMQFYYRPALLTIHAGLLSANLTAQVTSWQWPILDDLGPGDFFAFIGVSGIEQMKRHLKTLTSHGVYTVFYSTEADFAVSCGVKQSYHVREVWEYTQSNVLCCSGASRRTYRYVPPGYIPRSVLSSSSAKAKQLSFVGSANVHYDKRRRCLRNIARGLMTLSPNPNVNESRVAYCEDKVCLPGDCAKVCALRIRSMLTNDVRLDNELKGTASFLNVHKACHANATASVAACESFRFAPLLSAGAQIFSEHCHPADEEEYRGLIHFASPDDLPKAVIASWQADEGARTSAHRRAELFKQRFDPIAIFQRAGITAALRANVAHWRRGGRHSHLHSSNASSSAAGGGVAALDEGLTPNSSLSLQRPSWCH